MIESPFPSRGEFRFWLTLVRPDLPLRPYGEVILEEFLFHCGYTNPRVNSFSWTPAEHEADCVRFRTLPDWARTFVDRVSALKCDQVSPEKAAEILAEIPRPPQV